MKSLSFFSRAAVVAALLAIVGCSTVPETGRRQIMLIDASEERSMGLQAFEGIKKETPISRDAALQQRIQRIGERIAASVGRELPGAQWEFVVFDDPKTINAFALPGGKVGVYTGLINLAESDDEIAAVMGHEVAHVSSRHGGERMSQQMAAGLVGAVGVAATENAKHRDAWRMALTGGTGLGLLAFSREHESEADAIGMRFAANAGYDPRAAVTFWQKMAQKNSGGEPFKWLSTHPPTSERIANLQRLAPQYLATYEAARQRYQ